MLSSILGWQAMLESNRPCTLAVRYLGSQTATHVRSPLHTRGEVLRGKAAAMGRVPRQLHVSVAVSVCRQASGSGEEYLEVLCPEVLSDEGLSPPGWWVGG